MLINQYRLPTSISVLNLPPLDELGRPLRADRLALDLDAVVWVDKKQVSISEDLGHSSRVGGPRLSLVRDEFGEESRVGKYVALLHMIEVPKACS
jgi:hypothetical protein